MPPFSPCGLAVDWVRSCHHGFWRFYSNRPEVLTGGQYFFLPDDAPHLRCLHFFGTSDWIKGDPVLPNQRGEVAGVDWAYRPGGFEGRTPPAVPVGNCGDFTADWPYPPNIADRRNLCGIDSRCYTNVHTPFVDAKCLCELEQPALQLVYATLIRLLYENQGTTIATFLTCWFGPNVTITAYGEAGLLPSMVIVRGDGFTFCACNGTTNFQQLALQALQSGVGPTNQGAYSTLPLWQNTATLLIGRMETAGMLPGEPVVMTGHSYGACVVALAAARLRVADSRRDLCVMTFGMPRLGDTRLRNILNNTVNIVELANDDDLVTILPPSAYDIAPYIGLVGQALADLWLSWRTASMHLVMTPSGAQDWGAPQTIVGNTMLQILLRSLAHQSLEAISGHRIAEYQKRLSLIADPPECCVPVPCWAILFGGAPFAPYGVDMGGSGSVGFSRPTGLRLGGRGQVITPNVAQGIVVGGTGTVSSSTPIGSAGIALGGSGVVQSPEIGTGVEVGGAGESSADDNQGAGGAVLGGAGEVSIPITPGATCGAAPTLTLGVTYTFAIAAGAQNWFTFPASASTQYTTNYTVNSGSVGSCLTSTGSCALPVPQTTIFPPSGSASFTTSISATNGYVQVLGDFFSAGNYSFSVTSP